MEESLVAMVSGAREDETHDVLSPCSSSSGGEGNIGSVGILERHVVSVGETMGLSRSFLVPNRLPMLLIWANFETFR